MRRPTVPNQAYVGLKLASWTATLGLDAALWSHRWLRRAKKDLARLRKDMTDLREEFDRMKDYEGEL